MAQFDESKVINTLHVEKAEVGKKYWCSDSLQSLKAYVESNAECCADKLMEIDSRDDYPFKCNVDWYQFIYPYEELPKQRMTNIQFMEWLAKGNGLYKSRCGCMHNSYMEEYDRGYKEVDEDIFIRSWDSEEWIEPTVDIYERDCKGGKK